MFDAQTRAYALVEVDDVVGQYARDAEELAHPQNPQRRLVQMLPYHLDTFPCVLAQVTHACVLLDGGDHLDRVEPRAIQVLENGKHHVRGHAGSPQRLIAVSERCFDETRVLHAAPLPFHCCATQAVCMRPVAKSSFSSNHR
jgi:hypothetical protein